MLITESRGAWDEVTDGYGCGKVRKVCRRIEGSRTGLNTQLHSKIAAGKRMHGRFLTLCLFTLTPQNFGDEYVW